MSYIILNGKKSTLIQGLLIQTLPPITKPLMRTKTQEIDGRNGDIVTELGYSAYDKKLTIGLFGNFNINEVIEYFTSEGKVIFSNEPDKYYKYKITAQIDFEKLIRFRTATVTFHCQPFKYSAVDDSFSVETNLLNERIYSISKNGVTLNSVNGIVTIDGQASVITGIYVPIRQLDLDGDYTLSTIVNGTGYNAVTVRLIKYTPIEADTFGGQEVQMGDSLSASANDTYNFLYFSISPNVEMDFTVDCELKDDNMSSITIYNRGNTVSKPIVTFYGEDDVTISLNGTQIFEIALGDQEYITIDAEGMDAYKGDTLMNRRVSGNYNNLTLQSGENTISWNGTISKIEIENVSRWL